MNAISRLKLSVFCDGDVTYIFPVNLSIASLLVLALLSLDLAMLIQASEPPFLKLLFNHH